MPESKCICIWDYCKVAKRIALKVACTVCYPIDREAENARSSNL